MPKNVTYKKHHLLTTKQKIKKNKTIATIIITLVSLTVIGWSLIISFESARINHVYYDSLAEERIGNNGKTASRILDSYLQFCFQELENYKSTLDNLTPIELDDEDEVIAYSDYNKIDTFVDDIGIIYSGKAYFSNDLIVVMPDDFTKIESVSFWDGKKINQQEGDYLYFATAPCEKHDKIQGLIGRILKKTISDSIAPQTHADAESGLSNDSIILIDKNYDIVLFSSPNHEWRFMNPETGKPYANYHNAMRDWVDDDCYNQYMDFVSDNDATILNVGHGDRDAMIYRQSLADGEYAILFMAPKALLTKTIIDLSTSILVILYVVLVLLLFVSIFGVIIIFRQRKTSVISNTYSKLTKLNKEDTFYQDAAAIVFNNPNSKFAIVHLNIKEFGKINDVYGTQYADDILVILGSHIYETIDKDFEVACYKNGGHFLLLLEGNQDDIIFKITTLHESLPNLEGLENIKIKLTFGAFLINSSYPNLHKEAEKAFFAEKSIKNNEFLAVYDAEMDKIQSELEELSIRFDDAIANEEFEIYLQLKWNLKKNDWCGAETLVRWNHPKKGLLSPGRFIPLFEENGYITKLDIYVFEKSCQLLREMLDANERVVPLSINLSKKHFSNLAFMDTYEAIVSKYEIPHNLIEFEITEGLLMDNVDVFTRFIKVFHDSEYYIAMDDFGAGYSSLNMIHELDFDIIKIDAKFFRSGLDKSNKTIIQSIISLCHKLNKTVVAEGIENEHEVEFLKDVGCDIIQGYYFAKPIPANDFKEKLNKTEENE